MCIHSEVLHTYENSSRVKRFHRWLFPSLLLLFTLFPQVFHRQHFVPTLHKH